MRCSEAWGTKIGAHGIQFCLFVNYNDILPTKQVIRNIQRGYYLAFPGGISVLPLFKRNTQVYIFIFNLLEEQPTTPTMF